MFVVVPREVGGGAGEEVAAALSGEGVPMGERGAHGGGELDGVGRRRGLCVGVVGCRWHEGAYVVGGHETVYFGEVGGEDGDMRLDEVGESVGERVVVVEAAVFEQRDAEVGVEGERFEALRLEAAEEGDVGHGVGLALERREDVAIAGDEEMALGEVGHCRHHPLYAAADVDGALVEEYAFARGHGGEEVVDGCGRRWRRQGHVADNGHREAVALAVDVGYGLAHGDGGHVGAARQAREDEVLDFCPHTSHAVATDELWHLGEHLVGVEKERFAA